MRASGTRLVREWSSRRAKLQEPEGGPLEAGLELAAVGLCHGGVGLAGRAVSLLIASFPCVKEAAESEGRGQWGRCKKGEERELLPSRVGSSGPGELGQVCEKQQVNIQGLKSPQQEGVRLGEPLRRWL